METASYPPSNKSNEILPASATTDPQGPPMLSERATRTLWLRMGAIYGHRWISNYGTKPKGVEADTWRAALASMTPRQLAAGLRACALATGDGWPPSLPEFRARCFCIPSIEEVSVMLKPGAVEVSPFARLVYANIDAYELRRADADRARRIIREGYELASRHVLAGGELPAEVPRLEHDTQYEERLYRELHERRFAELKM